jgi:hypothetical protein
MKHKWTETSRTETRTVRICDHCGLRRITRHEFEIGGMKHWVEFWRGFDRIRLDGDRTPKCEPAGVDA